MQTKPLHNAKTNCKHFNFKNAHQIKFPIEKLFLCAQLTLGRFQCNHFRIFSLAKTVECFDACIVHWIKMQPVYRTNGFLSAIYFLFVLKSAQKKRMKKILNWFIQLRDSERKKRCEFKPTRNSPPLPSSNSSTYPSLDMGLDAFQATVTRLFTVEHSSWIIIGADGTAGKREHKKPCVQTIILLTPVQINSNFTMANECKLNVIWLRGKRGGERWCVSEFIVNYLFASARHRLCQLKQLKYSKSKWIKWLFNST